MKTIEEIKSELQNDKDYKKGDVYKAIVRIGHSWWGQNSDKTYADMINYVRENYGELFAVTILIDKYASQSMFKYIYRGYANGKIPANDLKINIDIRDISTHLNMVAMFNSLSLNKKIILGDKFLSIAKKLYVLIDENKYLDGDCEYREIKEECECCNGEGYVGNIKYDIECPICRGDRYIYTNNINDNYGGIYNDDYIHQLNKEYRIFEEQFVKNYINYLKSILIDKQIDYTDLTNNLTINNRNNKLYV